MKLTTDLHLVLRLGNTWRYTAILYVFMVWCLIKYGDNIISFARFYAFLVLNICVFWVLNSILAIRTVCSFQTLVIHIACYMVA